MTTQITSTLLHGLAVASFDNALRLIGDAEALVANSRWPGAHGLATLALEEFGKHIICVSAIGRVAHDPDYAARFRRRFRDHTDKLRSGILHLESLLARDIEGVADAFLEFDDLAKSAHVRRLRGLYVDFDDGHVLIPAEEITENEAAELVRRVGIFIRAAEATARGIERAEVPILQAVPDLSSLDPEQMVLVSLMSADLVRELLRDAIVAGNPSGDLPGSDVS